MLHNVKALTANITLGLMRKICSFLSSAECKGYAAGVPLILGWYCQVSLYPFNHERRQFNACYNEVVGNLILGYLIMCRTMGKGKLLAR